MAFQINTLKRGDSLAYGFKNFLDEFGVKATTLAGWDFRFAIKLASAAESEAALIDFGRSQLAIDNTACEVGVLVLPAQLASLAESTAYACAFKAKSPGGAVTTLLEEIFYIEPSIITTV